MSIDQRIPDLSDKELDTLHANAVRLAQSGTVMQRQQAESLLPLIGAEIEARSKAKAATAKPRRAVKKRVAAVDSASTDDADAE